MRNRSCVWVGSVLGAIWILGVSGCAAKAPVKPTSPAGQFAGETPVPTVASRTPTPVETAAPLPTRPLPKNVHARKGEAIGPVITFFGAARADGSTVDPMSVDKAGIPTYLSAVGSGFMLVVETKPGKSGLEPGRRVFAYDPNNPKVRPDLEIEADHDMGNGSPAVCDRRRPNIGGMPGINPPSFAETQKISDAINDLSCRFETFLESDSSCTLTKHGDYSFLKKDTMTQFCMIVAHAYQFPVGDTLLSVRVRDSDGNPGPVKAMRIHRPADARMKAIQKTKKPTS
jgi:hypothetical protein